MYFLTNKEGFIIAASNDFLSAIGSREICSISSMLHNQLIVVEDDKLEIPNKSLKYDCSISSMYSAFGELKLYTLKEIKEEDESIAYLRQIKSGKITKEDNEYSIPDIPILHKSKEEPEIKEEPTLTVETPKSKELETIAKEEIVKIEEPQKEEKPKAAIQEEEQATQEHKEETEPKDTLEIEEEKAKEEPKEETVTQEIKLEETVVEEHKEEIIKIEDSVADTKPTVEEKQEEPTQTQEKIETVTKEQEEPTTLKETKPEITKETEHKEESDPYNLKLIEEIEKIAVTAPSTPKEESQISQESIEQLADEIVKEQESKEEEKAKEEPIKIFANREVKEEQEPKEEPKIETTQEESKETLEPKEEIVENLIKIEPTNIEEEPKEELSGFKKITRKLFPWGRKDKDIELEDKDYEIDIKPAKELEEQQEPKEETIEIDKNEEIKVEKEPSEELENKEEEPTIDVDKEQVELEKPTQELATTVEPKEELIKPQEEQKEEIKEDAIATTQELEEAKESTEETQEEAKEPLKAKEPQDNSKIVYKLIGLQVDAIDLQANANKLSIDSSSYKMLVDNYLDEIEKYHDDLVNKTSSTINMLTDAGELLSLDLISKKLNELKDSQDTSSIVKEIALISTLLKEKLEQEEQTRKAKEQEVQEPEIPEIQSQEEAIEEPEEELVPKEVVDITTADALLNKITKESVKFDPQRAADELNLPQRLILEFVHDFIAQSKEHLPMVVDAYKSNDIQTIQTTAHMLKGAASNLRLDSIAENLFKIQKENSIERSGELIKDFVAKLKGLEEAIASMEDAEDEN